MQVKHTIVVIIIMLGLIIAMVMAEDRIWEIGHLLLTVKVRPYLLQVLEVISYSFLAV